MGKPLVGSVPTWTPSALKLPLAYVKVIIGNGEADAEVDGTKLDDAREEVAEIARLLEGTTSL